MIKDGRERVKICLLYHMTPLWDIPDLQEILLNSPIIDADDLVEGIKKDSWPGEVARLEKTRRKQLSLGVVRNLRKGFGFPQF